MGVNADFLNSAKALIQKLDGGRDEIHDSVEHKRSPEVYVFSFSASLSLGYILWLIRSGLLLSSVMAAMPAWRWVDPLPVLDRYATDDDDENNESLQSMVETEEQDMPPACRQSGQSTDYRNSRAC